MEFELFLEGLDFGESPRWYDGRFWYSDFFQGAVFVVDQDGRREKACDVPGQPSGLGWLPDGRMIVVSMLEHRIYRVELDGALALHADLTGIAIHPNDMVVSADGTAYVSHFGFPFYDLDPATRQIIAALDEDGRAIVGPQYRTATIVGVGPGGDPWTAAPDIEFANGCVIHGSSLLVGESVGQRYLDFPIADDGTLRVDARREWAHVPGTAPDGCTIDAEGGIWFADAIRGHLIRVIEGGEITDRVKAPMRAFACMLGGDDGRTLFAMCAPASSASACSGKRSGVVFTARVDHPHAGRP